MPGARFGGDEAARLGSFWDILKCNIDELPPYRDHYVTKGLVDNDRVGVGGTSMGGFAALGCLAKYDWIRVVASYMGSGYYLDLSRTRLPPCGSFNTENEAEHARRMRSLEAYDISQQLENLGDRPLFVWHGQRDDIVPFSESTRLQNDLATRNLAGKARFMLDPNGEHKVPTMNAATAGVDFFSTYL